MELFVKIVLTLLVFVIVFGIAWLFFFANDETKQKVLDLVVKYSTIILYCFGFCLLIYLPLLSIWM
mgnify:CR=1 FL=1